MQKFHKIPSYSDIQIHSEYVYIYYYYVCMYIFERY